MEQTNHTESVRRVVAGKIRRILEMKNDGQRKAILANLRRGAGRVPGELPELWGEFLGDLPEELYGSKRGPSRAEWAVYTALTLFALHQQGHDPTQERERMNQENVGLGAAAAKILMRRWSVCEGGSILPPQPTAWTSCHGICGDWFN